MGGRRLPKSFPAAEVKAMLGAANREQDRLMLLCGLLLGLRVSEITKLEIPDIEWVEGIAQIRQAKGDKDRAVPIPNALLEQLRTWIAGRTVGYLFPSPRGGKRLSSRAVQLMLKRVALRAGLPNAAKARKYVPHGLRHTAATAWLRSGANIMEIKELLGHTSISVTQLYVSADPSSLKGVVERSGFAVHAEDRKPVDQPLVVSKLGADKSEIPPQPFSGASA